MSAEGRKHAEAVYKEFKDRGYKKDSFNYYTRTTPYFRLVGTCDDDGKLRLQLIQRSSDNIIVTIEESFITVAQAEQIAVSKAKEKYNILLADLDKIGNFI